MTANPKTPDPNRITGPAGTRILVPRAGGWSIEHETGPTRDDPWEETRDEALTWAREIVGAPGKPLPLRPVVGTTEIQRISPNERVDALAKAGPTFDGLPGYSRDYPKPGDVVGRYEGYEARDLPLKRSRR